MKRIRSQITVTKEELTASQFDLKSHIKQLCKQDLVNELGNEDVLFAEAERFENTVFTAEVFVLNREDRKEILTMLNLLKSMVSGRMYLRVDDLIKRLKGEEK